MISAVVLTKNEEKNIASCIESLTWCDEIIVIDDNSNDKTEIIAQKMGAKVFKHSLNNDFSAQRNYGLEKVNNLWVLFVDADERVPHTLQYEITQLINDPMNETDGYFVKRRDVLWGKKLMHGEVANVKLLRLGKKGRGDWNGKVHEVWNTSGKTGEFKNLLFHYPHQTVEDFIKEVNYYSDVRSLELYEKKVHSYWWSIFLYPTLKFFRSYIFWFGFLDGVPGFLVATMMSFHSFLVRGKLWLLWQRK